MRSFISSSAERTTKLKRPSSGISDSTAENASSATVKRRAAAALLPSVRRCTSHPTSASPPETPASLSRAGEKLRAEAAAPLRGRTTTDSAPGRAA
eukprot:scaffold1954_cov268-Pinguiococcus_pyrenoidosus.AAC.82